jgi:hypothetical protein
MCENDSFIDQEYEESLVKEAHRFVNVYSGISINGPLYDRHLISVPNFSFPFIDLCNQDISP